MVIAAMKLKDACSMEESFDKSRQFIKGRNITLLTKSLESKLWFFQ